VQEELAIEADRQVLAAVIGNLVHNAFKFTRPHSAVTLKVRANADRVLIEVHDECGGLPGEGEGKELSPSSEQRGADRTGLGIGLAFSRWGARNLPGTGCVFTVDLPRSSVPAPALSKLDAAGKPPNPTGVTHSLGRHVLFEDLE